MNKQIQTKTQTDDLKELVISFIASNKTIQKVGQEKIEMAVKIAVANGLNPLKKRCILFLSKTNMAIMT